MTKSILLVEDDARVAWATSTLLAQEGYCVHKAGSLQETLHLLDTIGAPGAIVADFRLPDANGVEVVNMVRERTVSTVPALLVTGLPPNDHIRQDWPPECLLLMKPVHFDTLKQALEQVLDSQVRAR